MSNQSMREHFTQTLFALLSETFEQVQGIYLDRGTALFETLATISADEASRPVSASCANLAAQVNHVRFYLEVLSEYIQAHPVGKVDWQASWQVGAVSPAEWAALTARLRAEYERVVALLRGIESWEGEDEIGGALAIVVHTAYHLGEIRQALCVLRPQSGA
ncbi:MAG TPA: hypothetical protein PKK15_06805 [Kouleothrix sp.]|uniref:hypothetical protein n=1 Tax=Kouleothrix sp. TaxID=2779161 RepID=UPI002B87F68A|nr:hypothetical protein [Kouleothrix sp.]